jgi:hypothetical protein
MGLDYPEQSYYPSAKLRLTFRLDEFGNTTRLKAPPPHSVMKYTGVWETPAPLVVITDPGAPQGVTRYLVVIPGQTSVPPATDQARSDDGLTFDVTVIPSEMDWNLNGIRTADTLSAKFKYIDAPLHPLVARSVAVEAFFGCVSPTEYQRGIQGAKRQGYAIEGQGESLRVIQDTYLDSNNLQRTNSRFTGFCDTWDVDWSANEEPMIEIKCRDNTQLLIDQQCPQLGLCVDGTKPLDQAIAGYLANFAQFQGLSVEYRPNTDNPPVLNSVLGATALRKLGPVPMHGGGSAKLTVWDYLTDICGAVGHVIRVEGNNIIVQTARSITTSAITRRVDDPYQGRSLPSGMQCDYRRFIYGQNIEKMKFKRHFTKNQPVNIEVRCWDNEKKTLLSAKFPEIADRQKYVIPGNAQPTQKWEEKYVYGIRDVPTLKKIAQTYYEQIGRNEIQVDISTHNLASFGGGNLDPDILDMKAGDTFEVLVQKRDQDETNTLTRIESLLQSQDKCAAFMQTLGFSSDFATAYAKAYTDAGFLTLYRLRGMKVKWNISSGISLDIQGINYIEVRADASLPAGQEPGTTQSATPPLKPVQVNNALPNVTSTTNTNQAPPPPNLTQQQLNDLHAAGYSNAQIAALNPVVKSGD